MMTIDQLAELLKAGVSLDAVDKLLEVQRALDVTLARCAYVRAMTEFKGAPLHIAKNKAVSMKLRNKDGSPSDRTLNYRHETLAQVVELVAPRMAAHGLNHSWSVRPSDTGMIEVTCMIGHVEGHVEEVSLIGEPDSSGQKNTLQQMRSTVTYLQRATLLLATGLAADDDDDAQKAGRSEGSPAERQPSTPGVATPAQLTMIGKKLAAAGKAQDELETALKLEAGGLVALPFERVNEALAWIKAAKP